MRKWLVMCVALSMSCSIALQDGVRSAGNACSESNFYWIADALVAIGLEVVIAQGTDPNPAVDHIPTAVFGVSSLVGLYKHHHCVRYRADVEAHRIAVCSGGARPTGKQCFCADGMVSNGLTCQGTPIAGNCTGGMYPFGPAHECKCLAGWKWNGSECVELQCTGGSVAGNDDCQCPNGTTWDGNQCQQPAAPADTGDTNQAGDATQDPDQSPDAAPQAQQVECPGGAVASGDGCACPDGTQWDGNQCVGASPQAPAPRHRRDRRTPAPQPVIVQRQQPAPAAPQIETRYHAMYEPSKGARMACMVFDDRNVIDTTGTHDKLQMRMAACSQWCTSYLADGRKCQCRQGGCP